jgi:hypothetical protein
VFGVNQNDGSLFVPLSIVIVPVKGALSDEGLAKILLHFFTNNTQIVDQILVEYPHDQFTDNYVRMSTLLRDAYFECVVRGVFSIS